MFPLDYLNYEGNSSANANKGDIKAIINLDRNMGKNGMDIVIDLGGGLEQKRWAMARTILVVRDAFEEERGHK